MIYLKNHIFVPVVFNNSQNKSNFNLLSDTDRNVQESFTLSIDTRRRPIYALHAVPFKIISDTRKNVGITFKINTDTIIKYPCILDKSSGNTQSITISLQSQQLSDTFSISTVKPLEVLDSIKGTILDYNYQYGIESYTKKGIIYNIKGMYDVDKILYTPFTYKTPDKNVYASTHGAALSSTIGKGLVAHFHDFMPSENLSSVGATWQNIVSSVFGWTSRLPRLLINVYIRNNTLYIIQRGQETNIIDLTSTKRTMPEISHTLCRSVRSYHDDNATKTNTKTSDSSFDSNLDDDGAGNKKIYKDNGDGTSGAKSGRSLLNTEIHNGDVTNYSYDNDGNCISKETTFASGGRESVTYVYETQEKKKTQTEEHSKQYDESGALDTTRDTYHTYLGGGWQETQTYEDGELVDSVLTQSTEEARASDYIKNTITNIYNNNMDDYKPFVIGGSSNNIDSLIDTDFPVQGKEELERLYNEVINFNRCIEEKLTFDLYDYKHMIDFTDKIKIDDKIYYLVSNQIEQTTKNLKQSLVLIRWFKREDVE